MIPAINLSEGDPRQNLLVCEPCPSTKLDKRFKAYLMNQKQNETPKKIKLELTVKLIEKNTWITSLIKSSNGEVSCQLFRKLLAGDFETLKKMYVLIPDNFNKVRLLFHEYPGILSFEEIACIKNDLSKKEINVILREIRKVEYSIFKILSGLNSELNHNGADLMKAFFLAAIVGFKTVLDYKMLFKRNYCMEALIAITCLQGIALCIAKVYGMEAQACVHLPSEFSAARTIWNLARDARSTLVHRSPVRSVLEEIDYNFGVQELDVTPTELILFAGHAGARMRLFERMIHHLQWVPNSSSLSLVCLKDSIYFGFEEDEEVIRKHGVPIRKHGEPIRKKELDFWDYLRKHFNQEQCQAFQTLSFIEN